MKGISKQKSTIKSWLKIGNQFTSKIWRPEEDMDFGNIRLQKCVLREGYREHIWQNLTIGAFIWWGSRQMYQETTHFGALSVEIYFWGTFGDENFQVFLQGDIRSENLGNYLRRLLNVMPARIFLISSYLLRIKSAIFAWVSLNFLRCLEMKFFGVSVMGG